jgi:sugar O-acyltransferase (sialic acid O-acetyltransferase NeuD family)
MIKNIIILGTGGNCIDILDTINDINNSQRKNIYKCIGFLDDNKLNWGKEFQGIKVLGPLDIATKYRDCFFVNGIGSPSNFWKKDVIISRTCLSLEKFENIIHPSASVSRMSKLGYGVVVFQNATITSNVTIGNHVIILPNSVISHDDAIGNFTCIAGGVCISGCVMVGYSCYIGTNSSIIGNVKIGDYSLIGMGSVILKDVLENKVVVGNPAKVIRMTREKQVFDVDNTI